MGFALKFKDRQGKFNNKDESDSSKRLKTKSNENTELKSPADKMKNDTKPHKITNA